ncbi:MAG: peptide chain release factor N(5)-glutamine methyltransferase [Campylobacterota bacterium]|nr:peptide chain release factor N(5)-glutamine methyltransferase [Campylobacterota bacterium]
MTLAEALNWAVPVLKKSCERPLFEAELLLSHHLGKDRLYLHTHENDLMDDIEAFKALVWRREAEEPYEYIVGEVSFYDIYLQITPGVLIPRPETELLIDKVSEVIKKEGIRQIIEIGIGSGAISIVLARKFPTLEIVATDISDDALHLAQKNIDRYGVSDRITLVKTNLMDKVEMPAEMVVSNPPYIAADFKLERNVSEYEPHTALFGGEVGDELLRNIIDDTYLRGIKWLACEMGYDQREPIQKFTNKIGIELIEFYQDFAGYDRGFVLKI